MSDIFINFISFLKNFESEALLTIFEADETSLLKILYNLMCYFGNIFLSDTISSIRPKISDADT